MSLDVHMSCKKRNNPVTAFMVCYLMSANATILITFCLSRYFKSQSTIFAYEWGGVESSAGCIEIKSEDQVSCSSTQHIVSAEAQSTDPSMVLEFCIFSHVVLYLGKY